MEKLFDEYGCLNVEDLIMKSESFQKIMADDIVTEDEVLEQTDILRRLLAEVCVLVSVTLSLFNRLIKNTILRLHASSMRPLALSPSF